MSDYEDDAEAYNEHMEKIAAEYGPRALRLLERIRTLLHDNGFTCTQAQDFSSDDYRYSFVARHDEVEGEDAAADITVEIAEQRQYDGDTAPWGLNFGIDITRIDGLMIGGMTPYNYTEQCWVDSTDAEAVAERWSLLEAADIAEVPGLILAHIGDGNA